MKKIGLATFFYDDNFGTCLQAYALEYAIMKLGYDVSLIRYHRCKKMSNSSTGRLNKLFSLSPKTLFWWFSNRRLITLKKKAFNIFRSTKLHLSDDVDYYRDSDMSLLKAKYDAFVCGSDMMWSNEFSEDWPFYYLTFADKCKSISYAPSFGRNYLTGSEIQECKQYISNIGRLSCRESGGIELIKEKFSLNAIHVVDPTLLMTELEWRSFCEDQSRVVEGDYVLTYLFNGTIKHGRDKVIEQALNIVDCKMVILSGAEGKYKKYQYIGAGPVEFVRLYRDCKFVITDTYHGMLFAIIFNKPFIVLDKSSFGVTADRLVDTLKMLGISNRYVKTDITLSKYLEMDYSRVNEILAQERNNSVTYLNDALKNATV